MTRPTTLRVLLPVVLAPMLAARIEGTLPRETSIACQQVPQVGEETTDDASRRTDLLELAFTAVSRMPTVPHLKNRARAQERVVAAWLTLGEPQRAERAAAAIDNWRRGRALASIGCYYARGKQREEAERLLEGAESVAVEVTPQAKQAWRIESLRARIARGKVLLGVESEEDPVLTVATPEGAEVVAAYAEYGPTKLYPRIIEVLEEAAEVKQLEPARGALKVYAVLCSRYASDIEKRRQLLEGVDACAAVVPPQVRVESFVRLADVDREEETTGTGAVWLERSEEVVHTALLSAEVRVPLLARIAAAWARAGSVGHARELLEGALHTYDSERLTIIDIYRTGVLIPVAEGYAELGDHSKAEAIYLRALFEAEENPNGRPRAENLSAICISIQTRDLPPSSELEGALRRLAASLSEPW